MDEYTANVVITVIIIGGILIGTAMVIWAILHENAKNREEKS